MSYNPTLSFVELAAAQAQPEVPVNLGLRIVASAIAGKITINFPSNANYTLEATNPPDEDDEWYFSVIEMTDSGVLLSAGRDVIFPDLNALLGGGPTRFRFRFRNSTLQTLTVKLPGQTGVPVPAGTTAELRVNNAGTDVEAITNAETVIIQIACSDMSTPLSPAERVAVARAPRAFSLQEVRGSLAGADSSDDIVVDIKKNGTTVLSTKITIEQGDTTSLAASTANQPVVSVASFADDDEISIDHDSGGDDGTGLVVTLIGISA